MLGLRCGDAQLEVTCGTSLLHVLDKSGRQVKSHQGILRSDGNLVRGIRGIVRLPFLEFFGPIRNRDLAHAVDKGLFLSVVENPFKFQIESLLVRERILGEALGVIEFLVHEQHNGSRSRIRIAHLVEERGIDECEIEDDVVRQAHQRTEDHRTFHGEYRIAGIRFRGYGSKVIHREHLDLVTIRQTLVRKPAAQARIARIEKTGRQDNSPRDQKRQ